MTVQFLDVGQGDCTLIVDHSSGAGMIVDCPAKGAVLAIESIRAAGVRLLDTAVITHWDLDHFGGILYILDQVGCRQLLYNHDTLIANTPEDRSKVLATFRRIIDRRHAGVLLNSAREGDGGTLGNVEWSFLAPSHRHLTTAITLRDRNLGSGVVLLTITGTRVLIGGDADGRVWQRLLDAGINLQAEVLRAPHHGALRSKVGSVGNATLLDAVDPKHLVISVGTGNVYHHPVPEIIRIANDRAIRVMCTEVTSRCALATVSTRPTCCAGTVTLTFDDQGMQVSPDEASHMGVISSDRKSVV